MRKLPKTKIVRAKLDAFDLEAEAEGSAIRSGPQLTGPKGKKLKGGGRHHPRGEAIAEFRATRHIEFTAA